MGQRETLLERFTRSLNLHTEPVPGLPLAEIAGSGRVLIENHKGIVQYSCNEILTKVCFGYLRICGKDLNVLQMTKEQLVIGGCIDAVQLIRRG